MPSFVNPEKCDGCKALDKTACQHICPNDLMVLKKDISKAFNREPEMCWECYNCVKICPQQAIDVRGYGLRSHGRISCASEGIRRHYVDREVPQRNGQKV